MSEPNTEMYVAMLEEEFANEEPSNPRKGQLEAAIRVAKTVRGYYEAELAALRTRLEEVTRELAMWKSYARCGAHGPEPTQKEDGRE